MFNRNTDENKKVNRKIVRDKHWGSVCIKIIM